MYTDFSVVTAALCRRIRSSGGDITHESNKLLCIRVSSFAKIEKEMFVVLNPHHHSVWMNKHFCCEVSLSEWLPVLSEVFMMCGLLRRLSLDTILNLNLPMLACKQEDSCRQERGWCSHLISHCTHTHKQGELLHIFFLSFKAKQGRYSVCIVFWASSSCFLHLASSTIKVWKNLHFSQQVSHKMYSTFEYVEYFDTLLDCQTALKRARHHIF